MQAAAMTIRFLTGCSSKTALADSEIVVSDGGSLPRIVASHLVQTVSSRQAFLKLTDDLINFAEMAFALRDLNTLQEVSRVLLNLPGDAARQVGLYYHAIAINRKGHRDEAETQLVIVADTAPISYRARAIQTLGANYHDRGQLDETLRLQLEALRAASDKNAQGLRTTLMAHLEIAIVRSLAGDHKGALSDLEKLWPLVCHVAKQHPLYFYLYHNELAVELNEVGRVEEAEAACRVAIASPFASAYPEWSETRDEIAAKRASATPSVAVISRAPEADRSPQIEAEAQPEPSRVTASDWLPGDNAFLQRTLLTIAATPAIVRDEVTQSTADQVLICCGPRAPPALF